MSSIVRCNCIGNIHKTYTKKNKVEVEDACVYKCGNYVNVNIYFINSPSKLSHCHFLFSPEKNTRLKMKGHPVYPIFGVKRKNILILGYPFPFKHFTNNRGQTFINSLPVESPPTKSKDVQN